MNTNEATNPGTPNAKLAAKNAAPDFMSSALDSMEEADFTISRTAEGFQANGTTYQTAWAACQAIGF